MANVVELPKDRGGLGRVPPHDTDSEAVVLSAVVLDPARYIPLIEHLPAHHFFSHPNRLIYEAVRSLWAQSKPIDLMRVKGALTDSDKLKQVGGVEYLVQVVEASPAVANLVEHAGRISEKWRARQVIQACQNAAGEAYSSTDLSKILETLRTTLDADLPVNGGSRWGESLGWQAACSSRATMQWLCRPLGWSTGLVCGIAGYGYAGKTVAAAAALVQSSASLPIWGMYGVEKPLRWLYLDYEQGPILTLQRIQRLLRGHALGPLECTPVDVRCLPPSYLSDPGTERELVRATAGFDMVLIDSFRAAFPALDENSSEARSGIDMLRRVAATNNLCVLLLLHGRKPSKDDVGGQKTALRGSSSIYDALSSVLMLEGRGKDAQGRNTSCVTHTKSRETGICLDQFDLTIEDVGDQWNPRDGLMVAAHSTLKAHETDENRTRRAALQTQDDARSIVEAMRHEPPTSWRGMLGLCNERFGWSRVRTELVLGAVTANGRLVTSLGRRRATLYHHPDVKSELFKEQEHADGEQSV